MLCNVTLLGMPSRANSAAPPPPTKIGKIKRRSAGPLSRQFDPYKSFKRPKSYRIYNKIKFNVGINPPSLFFIMLKKMHYCRGRAYQNWHISFFSRTEGIGLKLTLTIVKCSDCCYYFFPKALH